MWKLRWTKNDGALCFLVRSLPTLAFTAEFDFLAAMLVVRTTAGDEVKFPLAPGSMSDFYALTLESLHSVGVEVAIDPMPNELADGVRFDRDYRERSFDTEVAR